MSSLTLEAPVAPLVSTKRFSAGRMLLWGNGLALLAVAVFLRCWHLGNIPGVNGDEAWYGVQALLLLRGDPIAWLTPTGNPINPFFFVPLLGLHYFGPPSIALLRVTALVSGLAALAVNYVLCRRVFDHRTAAISTLILALLPINIAYSRFAWDASQSLLFTLPVVYLPLLRLRERGDRPIVSGPAVGAAMAAIVVHPTNIFAAVFVVLPPLYTRRRKIAEIVRHSRLPAKTRTFAALVALLGVIAWLAWSYGPAVAARLHGPGELGAFVANYLRLFSGATVYEFISGAGLATSATGWFQTTTLACNLGFALVMLAALLGVVRRIEQTPSAVDVCLAVGWLAMLAGFFVVAGPESIAPHFERYGICLIAPGALIVARGLAWWIERLEPHGNRLAIVLAMAVWLWPASFYVNYFQCFLERGGLSHKTFRTAAIDPKQAALSCVLEHRRKDGPIEIVTHPWWSYWPLRYLAFGEPDVRVVTWDAWRSASDEAWPPRVDRTWFVEFAGSSGELETLHAIGAAGKGIRRYPIVDYGGRPLIWVVAPSEDSSRNNQSSRFDFMGS